jgi:hypothetical protein
MVEEATLAATLSLSKLNSIILSDRRDSVLDSQSSDNEFMLTSQKAIPVNFEIAP